MQTVMETSNQTSPDGIMQIGFGFWASKIMLTAIKFELFTKLAANGGLTAAQIKSALGLQCSDRHAFDFLDALTSFGFLTREGILETARYSNSDSTALFLDKNKPSYIGGILEMANNRLYDSWGRLENGLITGKPQNEIKNGTDNPFDEIYKTPEKLTEFVNAMSGIQMGNFEAFAQKMDFSGYKTLADIGGSGAMLSIMVAKHQPHMQCTSFDLPAIAPIATANIARFNFTERIKVAKGDFFADPLPHADVLVMGNILHDWDENKKLMLMKKAFDALPANGVLVVIENIIDNERNQNKFGLMMSLNMLIETGHGFDYTFNDFTRWSIATGFNRTAIMPLTGPASACMAYK